MSVNIYTFDRLAGNYITAFRPKMIQFGEPYVLARTGTCRRHAVTRFSSGTTDTNAGEDFKTGRIGAFCPGFIVLTALYKREVIPTVQVKFNRSEAHAAWNSTVDRRRLPARATAGLARVVGSTSYRQPNQTKGRPNEQR